MAVSTIPSLNSRVDSRVDEQIDNKFGDDIGDNVTAWLTEHVTPSGTAVVVDDTLTIEGAAADAKKAGDEITGLKNVLSAIISYRTLNEYNVNNISGLGIVTNDYTYFVKTPLESGEVLKEIEFYSPAVGTFNVSLCTLNFDNGKATLIKKYEIQCSIGVNKYVLPIPFVADDETYIGIGGRGTLMYRNDANGAIYGTRNNPLYQCSTAVSESGTSFSSNANAYFIYPFFAVAVTEAYASKSDLEAYASKSDLEAYAPKSDLEAYATKEDLDKVCPDAVLNRGNILRYKRTESTYTLWGRWFDMTINGTARKVTNNAGSEIMFFVTGASSIVFSFDQRTPNTIDPYMAFSIDGGEFVREQISSNSVTLSLPDSSDHLVRMSIDAISETDNAYKWNGTNAFALVSITPNAGSMIGITPMNKVGMYFGDSLTEGVNVLGSGGNNTVQSATQAYSYWTARNLNSARYCIGYGGSGMTKTGSFRPCIDAVNYYKNDTSTDVYYPDYIVVNHGVNDYLTVSSEDFCSAYKVVIDRLRIKYPGVPIFMVYPFLSSATNIKYVDGMRTLSNQYANVYFINTLGWNGETTDGIHLSVNGAKHDGELLAEAILNVLGKEFFL